MTALPPLDINSWIISDTHFGHNNIIRFCGRPENHDTLMRDLWLESVAPNDVVLHLGDLTYRGGAARTARLLDRLPGRKFLLPGNHDKKSAEWYANFDFKLLDGLPVETESGEGRTIYKPLLYWIDPEGRRICFSHHPEMSRRDWDINIHGHIHNSGYAPSTPAGYDYRNVSVEVIGYRPRRLGDILGPGDGIHYVSPATAGIRAHNRRGR